jgi:ubiquinone/menaquinone biosynthesis C-methylase UbiE
MKNWEAQLVFAIFFLLASISLFFFVFTRGALLLRAISTGSQGESSHVYPMYSNMWLIKMVDFQPVIAAILLFQYDALVSKIVAEIAHAAVANMRVLVTSCAFGNVIPRVVRASVEAGARRILVTDLIANELTHAHSKLGADADRVEFVLDNATSLKEPDGTVDINVIFFLLHELPHPMKIQALREAGRVLAPGGKLLLAEFHRPTVPILQALSWLYFTVFEPLGLALWSTHDPVRCLEEMGGWTCERSTYLFGNFQVVVATKH